MLSVMDEISIVVSKTIIYTITDSMDRHELSKDIYFTLDEFYENIAMTLGSHHIIIRELENV